MKRVFIVFALLWSRTAFAQTEVIVTGQVINATRGYVEFRLMPWSSSIHYYVPTVGVIASQSSRCGIDATGQVVNTALNGPCEVWGNDAIMPANTTYTVVFAPNNTVTQTVPQESITGQVYKLNQPVFAPIVKLVPQYATITSPPLQANLLPAANNAYTIGAQGAYYAAGYFTQLFTQNFNSTGTFSATQITATNITATGTLTANAFTIANLNVNSLTVSNSNLGTAQATTLAVTGTSTLAATNITGTLNVSGGLGVNSISGTSATFGTLTVTGQTSFGGQNYTWPPTPGTAGNVLTTNGSGSLTWSPGGGGSITGSGTLGSITKWTSTSALGNSVLSDNGTNVGLGINPVDDTVRDFFEVFGNQNNDVRITLRNGNSGTFAETALVVRNGAALTNLAFSFGVTSLGFTPVSGLANAQAYILSASGASNGMNIRTNLGPIFLAPSGNVAVQLTTDPFFQLTTSYAGSTLCAVGSVAFRNNAGTIETCSNGAAWVPLGSGGGGGSITGAGTANFITKWTSGSVIANSTISDDGTNITFNSQPTIAHNAIAFINSSKQLQTSEGYLNWDSTNHLLYVGFGPLVDFTGSTGILTSGASGVTVATANSGASTGNFNVVSGQYVSINAGKTGTTGVRLPFVIFTNANESFRLTLDPFLQLTTSYNGGTLCGSGTVGLRNNGGTLEVCQNGTSWGPLGGGGGTVTGSGFPPRVASWSGATSLTASSIIDNTGAISGPTSLAIGPGTLPAFTVFYGSSNTGSLYTMDYASADQGSAALSFRKMRGSVTIPSNVQEGDNLGAVISTAYNGGFQGTSKIVFQVEGVGSPGQRPGSQINFQTNFTASGLAVAMTLHNNQHLQLNGYTAGTLSTDSVGNVTASSDVRLKNVQGQFEPGLAEILQIDPIRYKWNQLSRMDMEHEYVGFSAQNVRDALGPLAVGQDKDGYLSLNDRAIIGALVNAVKELNERIPKNAKEN